MARMTGADARIRIGYGICRCGRRTHSKDRKITRRSARRAGNQQWRKEIANGEYR